MMSSTEMYSESTRMASHKFFANTDCEYYPCHKTEKPINCLFCYCPLYYLECKGFYGKTASGIKDCSKCLIPHLSGGWEYITEEVINHGKKANLG